MRSILTSLGIIIGVSAVIIMLAVGQGASVKIQKDMASMGSNLLMVSSASVTSGGVRMGQGTRPSLTLKDAYAIRKNCPSVGYVAPYSSEAKQITYGNQNWSTSIAGTTAEYMKIRDWNINLGRNLSEEDILNMSKVAIIGNTVSNELFGDLNPIGKTIRIGGVPFKVIGLLESKGQSSMGQDQDDVVLAPYSTVMKRLLAQTYLGGIFASALTEDMTEEAVEEITSILRREHKLKATDDDDFTIRTQQELSSMLNTTTDLMTTLLACIAGISLVVGGIGIMNIMYVSVTERTREIGLRMSVGARGVDILSQFLIEAILISITGGLIGVIIGCGASFMIKAIAHWPVFIQPWSVLLSFAVCTVTGVFFGWYPAKKAADLDPIDAIRYE